MRSAQAQQRAIARVHARGGKPWAGHKPTGSVTLTDEEADEICACVLLMLDRLNNHLNPQEDER